MSIMEWCKKTAIDCGRYRSVGKNMIKMRKSKFVMLIVIIVICTSLVTVGIFTAYATLTDSAVVKKQNLMELENFAKKYSKLYQLDKTIKNNFLWDVKETDMMNGVYKGLLGSLNDKYSSYMTKEEMAKWTDYMNGEFSGVGVNFAKNDKDEYVILSILPNSAAEESKLKAGDIIVAVDGKAYNTAEEMKVAMRGEQGTKVSLTYKRNGVENTIEMIRSVVAERSVYSTLLDKKTGYIGIVSFEKNTAKQFRTELNTMELKNVENLVIDIRGNGGGYTEQGIEIADMLLPECTITYMTDKSGKKTYYNSDQKATTLDYVVLVNGNTASTSEILAAAIQDNDGGEIIGTKTYGKGIVQGTFAFNDGSAVKMTIMQYFSPKGKVIHNKGVKPDYEIELKPSDKIDYQLEKAKDVLVSN